LFAYENAFGGWLFDYLKNLPVKSNKDLTHKARKARKESVFDLLYGTYDVLVFLKGNDLQVQFRGMKKYGPEKSPRYYSETGPSCLVNGVERRLSYNLHVYERMFERMMGSKEATYMNYGDFFCIFHDTLPDAILFREGWWENDDDGGAISIWKTCHVPGLAGIETGPNLVAREILGDKYKEGQKYFLLQGYATVKASEAVNDRTFWECTTFLMPGFSDTARFRGMTPEYRLLQKQKGPLRAELEESIDRCQSFRDIMESKDYRARKWFHDNGCRQVIEAPAS
jgi:hypothetical protein